MRSIFACAPFVLISILFGGVSLTAANGRKVIIDTDAGADDAVALLLALMYEKSLGNPEEFEILAITCVYGNTYESNVERNVLKTLTVANRSDIPVYAGAHKPLILDYEASDYFGKDGFGDFEFTEKIIAKVDESKVAALALTEIVNKYPGEVEILCLGPLTNIGTAIALDRGFARDVKELIVMGGSVYGVGNRSPNVEFNFSQDPESNSIVFGTGTARPITLFPWETALKYPLSKDFRERVFGARDTRLVKFLNQAEGVYLKKVTAWTVVDAMTTAIVLWPELVVESVETNVTPVRDGTARGTILVDYLHQTGQPNNTRIVQGYDVEAFKAKLLKYIE